MSKKQILSLAIDECEKNIELDIAKGDYLSASVWISLMDRMTKEYVIYG